MILSKSNKIRLRIIVRALAPEPDSPVFESHLSSYYYVISGKLLNLQNCNFLVFKNINNDIKKIPFGCALEHYGHSFSLS